MIITDNNHYPRVKTRVLRLNPWIDVTIKQFMCPTTESLNKHHNEHYMCPPIESLDRSHNKHYTCPTTESLDRRHNKTLHVSYD